VFKQACTWLLGLERSFYRCARNVYRLIGEIFSGSMTDYMIRRARIRVVRDGMPVEPEIRLRGIWPAAVIVPLGLVMWVNHHL